MKIIKSGSIDLMDLLDMKELPWPEVKVPEFAEIDSGGWRLESFKVAILRGYWRGLRPIGHLSYRLFKDNVLWMSTTPMELESQQHAIEEFSGHVGIGGGGMGITAYNAALKDSVTAITIFEIDPAIIDFVERQADLLQWPNWNKVKWVNADIRTMKGYYGPPIDFLWVDIWENLGEKKAIGDTIKLQAKVRAKKVGWWGMELDFISFLQSTGRNPPPTLLDWKRFEKYSRMPLMRADGQFELATDAATNVYLA